MTTYARPAPTAFPLLAVLGLVLTAVVTTTHAVEKHGQEAQVIRDCVQHDGAYLWQDAHDPNKLFHLCLLPDGRWGLQIVYWREALKHFVERTAFVKGHGSLLESIEYLARWATPIH